MLLQTVFNDDANGCYLLSKLLSSTKPSTQHPVKNDDWITKRNISTITPIAIDINTNDDMNNGFENFSPESITFSDAIDDVTNEIKNFSSTTNHSENEIEGRYLLERLRAENRPITCYSIIIIIIFRFNRYR